MTNLVDQLHNDQLQNVSEIVDLIQARCQIVQSSLLVGMEQHEKGISLARHVLLGVQEVGNQFRSVRNQPFEVLVDGEYSEYGISPNIRMTVFQASSNSWHQWFQKFRLFQFAQKSQG